MRQGMQKGAKFGTTLPLFYHTSDWLNQQNQSELHASPHIHIWIGHPYMDIYG